MMVEEQRCAYAIIELVKLDEVVHSSQCCYCFEYIMSTHTSGEAVAHLGGLQDSAFRCADFVVFLNNS